ncbi:conserved hypothetical protein [Culex quinquefasciatus]|uniref:Uncharacterized protein n=1 Tax=Culex quinquefasciatus TaxID=7176 RepID=B0XKJ2_CULQU|nr:conserved hypothetical protein [Culex quinquefasciatus]|eukprot:XP_001870164.1 conserved hypothetical protein [Culex quinquefasciatus]
MFGLPSDRSREATDPIGDLISVPPVSCVHSVRSVGDDSHDMERRSERLSKSTLARTCSPSRSHRKPASITTTHTTPHHE